MFTFNNSENPNLTFRSKEKLLKAQMEGKKKESQSDTESSGRVQHLGPSQERDHSLRLTCLIVVATLMICLALFWDQMGYFIWAVFYEGGQVRFIRKRLFFE